MTWLLLSLALAESSSHRVVAIGDGLVAAPVEEVAVSDTIPGGWVAVLGDCLEERAPKAWTVLDRTKAGATAASVHQRLGEVLEVHADLVLVGVGAMELARSDDRASFEKELMALVSDLRGDLQVMLVGMVAPTVAQSPDQTVGSQANLDARTLSWNQALAKLARTDQGVSHLDLWTDWPKEDATRGQLTVGGFRLSDKGHARVGTAVCDAILSHGGLEEK